MADTLTKKQEALVEKYYQKVLKNGLKANTDTDMAKARKHIDLLYKKYLEQDAPEKIVLVQSPEEAIAIVAKSTGRTPKDLVSEVQYLNLWTWWVAYYSAGINILEETCEKNLVDMLDEYESIINDLHAILPCEKVCFVIDYPKAICLKDNDLEKFQFHREGGLAVEYKDGTGFAWLNGTEVPDYVAVLSPDQIPLDKLMAETNVDVRREGLRRVGPDMAMKALKATTLDKQRGKHAWDNYELLEADFGDKKRRFLKMYDVAAKTDVIERVEDRCQTVLEALAMQCQETSYVQPTKIT